VISMSLGGGKSLSIEAAVASAHNANIPNAVAAGNSAANACDFSPAGAPLAVTVAAVDSTNTRASFSNYGPCVDLFAPGVDIVSSVPSGSFAVWSGTSMATPHVAGVLAMLLEKYPRETSTQIVARLIAGVSTSECVCA
jgi:subtilisin family serine protease